MLSGRTKPQRALILENMTRRLQLLQVLLVNGVPLALKIWAEVAANVRPFIPVQFEPFEAFVDRGGSCFGVARAIGVFDPQNEFALVVTAKQPVKQRGPRSADVQIAGRRRRKAYSNFSHVASI